VIVEFIDANREELGVEPICRVLQVAPSTYYAAKSRPPSARAMRDAVMMPILLALWVANYRVYGARKLCKAARRAGHEIGRDQVARLMRQLGIRGVRRGRRVITTRRDDKADRPPDRVNRKFFASAPNQLWVTDLTYVATWSGMAYVCFIVDAFSRMIVGWRVASNMRTDMALDALEMARWSRGTRLEGLAAHSDRPASGRDRPVPRMDHEQTDPFDEALPGLVTKLVQERKQRLLNAHGLVAELGIPVRHRDDPGTFALPLKRQVVPITRPPRVDTPFAAEPAFVTEDFEAALRIIRGARNSFERSPSMTAALDEENIRNLILVALNGHFEGMAGGELFNGNGKTDILIREADRNVFIGECKFWTGVKAFGEAIYQLLGYVVWRDAKAVLLLFIRAKGVTEIVEKAVTALASHPRCKRNNGGNLERHDFTFHRHGRPQPGDRAGAPALRPAGTLEAKLSAWMS
jgi:hypothetical protein